MTTAKILIKTSVSAISDLHHIQNHLRVALEVTLYELCEGSLGDPRSMEQMYEHISFLIGGVSKTLHENGDAH